MGNSDHAFGFLPTPFFGKSRSHAPAFGAGKLSFGFDGFQGGIASKDILEIESTFEAEVATNPGGATSCLESFSRLERKSV